MIYTQEELALYRESRENRLGLLSAMWVKGKGPRGGKVSIGKGRYDLLNTMLIEGKAEIVSRFNHMPLYAELQVFGIVVKLRRISKKEQEGFRYARHVPEDRGTTAGEGDVPFEP